MLPQAILKLILPKVLDHVMKVFKLNKVLSYVECENELDVKVAKLEEWQEKVEKKLKKIK